MAKPYVTATKLLDGVNAQGATATRLTETKNQSSRLSGKMPRDPVSARQQVQFKASRWQLIATHTSELVDTQTQRHRLPTETVVIGIPTTFSGRA